MHADGTAALDGVDLTVQDGHIMGVLGPSGSGKSTLLRVVAGLEPSTEGMIRVGGQDMTTTTPRLRELALVAQHRSLYGFLDVAGQLAFPLEVRGMAAEEVKRRTIAQRRAFGLSRIWRRRSRTLSAGDAQRTALARAMVRLPRALLLDEPLQLLDPPTQVRLREEIVRLQRASAMTVMFSTNDHNQVLGIADMVAVLRAGRTVQAATPTELLNRPTDMFVAGFVGEPAMTFVTGVVKQQGGLGRLVIGGQQVRFPGGLPGPLRERLDQRVMIGARPDMVVERALGDPVDLRLEGTAGYVQRLGRTDLVTVDVGDGSWVTRFPSGSGTRSGDHVQVTLAVRRLHVFDPGSGQGVWHGDDGR